MNKNDGVLKSPKALWSKELIAGLVFALVLLGLFLAAAGVTGSGGGTAWSPGTLPSQVDGVSCGDMAPLLRGCIQGGGDIDSCASSYPLDGC